MPLSKVTPKGGLYIDCAPSYFSHYDYLAIPEHQHLSVYHVCRCCTFGMQGQASGLVLQNK